MPASAAAVSGPSLLWQNGPWPVVLLSRSVAPSKEGSGTPGDVSKILPYNVSDAEVGALALDQCRKSYHNYAQQIMKARALHG